MHYCWKLTTTMFKMQFGLFCIFDGHGGANAAKTASKLVFSIQIKFPARDSEGCWQI